MWRGATRRESTAYRNGTPEPARVGARPAVSDGLGRGAMLPLPRSADRRLMATTWPSASSGSGSRERVGDLRSPITADPAAPGSAAPAHARCPANGRSLPARSRQLALASSRQPYSREAQERRPRMHRPLRSSRRSFRTYRVPSLVLQDAEVKPVSQHDGSDLSNLVYLRLPTLRLQVQQFWNS